MIRSQETCLSGTTTLFEAEREVPGIFSIGLQYRSGGTHATTYRGESPRPTPFPSRVTERVRSNDHELQCAVSPAMVAVHPATGERPDRQWRQSHRPVIGSRDRAGSGRAAGLRDAHPGNLPPR